MITIKVNANVKGLELYSAQVKAKLPGVVRKHALAIQAKSAQDAPVDTGALKNSMIAEAGDGEYTWQVHDGVEYGVYQELGTSHGVSAKHFLGGACEKQANKFFGDVKEVLKG